MVIAHVAGAIVTSWIHREYLVRSMATGRKTGAPAQGIKRPWRHVALIILAALTCFWWLKWQGAPNAAAMVDSANTSRDGQHGDHQHNQEE